MNVPRVSRYHHAGHTVRPGRPPRFARPSRHGGALSMLGRAALAGRRRWLAVGLAAVAVVGVALVPDAAISGPFSGRAPSVALGAPHFVEETAIAGIGHVYNGGFEYAVGGGVAAFDCNGASQICILPAEATWRRSIGTTAQSAGPCTSPASVIRRPTSRVSTARTQSTSTATGSPTSSSCGTVKTSSSAASAAAASSARTNAGGIALRPRSRRRSAPPGRRAKRYRRLRSGAT